jgi:hypothetical protein
VTLVGLVVAPVASAVVCGQPAKPEGEPTLGELGLDPDNSDDTTVAFGADTDPESLELSFKVSGCTLDPNTDVTIEKSGDRGAVTLNPVAPKHEVLNVTGTIAPKKFDPGTSKVRLTLTSPSHQIKTQPLTLTLQRKQPRGLPLFFSALAALLGLFYAYEVARQAAIDAYDKAKANPATPPAKPGFWKGLFRRKKDTTEPAKPKSKVKYGGFGLWTVVLVGAAGAAGAAFGAGYIKNDTWGSDEFDWVILLVAVAAAAAGGAAGGLTKAVTANT